MAPSRKSTNGRSPLVNKQHQITAFFSKAAASKLQSQSQYPVSPISTKTPNSQNPNPNPEIVDTPNSPTTPSPLNAKARPKATPKPVLVIGSQKQSGGEKVVSEYGEEVVSRRIRVYWPLDKEWYEGCVKGYDKGLGKHVVEYDDGDDEMLDLSKEKIEWVGGEVKKFRRLRKVSMFVDEDESEGEEGKRKGGGNVSGGEVEDDDDSSDEDWGKNVDVHVANEEEEVMELVDEEEEKEEEMVRVKRKRRGENSGGGAEKKRKEGEAEGVDSSNKKKKGGFVFTGFGSKPEKVVTATVQGD